MRVLFLDIDGVLNSHDWWNRRQSKNLTLDPEAVARLDRLIGDTECVVVISSTWRLGNSLVSIQRALVANGLTPEHADRIIGATRARNGRERGQEIQAWLDAVGDAVTAYAVVDDDTFDLQEHIGRLVKTNIAWGLRDDHCERLKRLLTTLADTPTE